MDFTNPMTDGVCTAPSLTCTEDVHSLGVRAARVAEIYSVFLLFVAPAAIDHVCLQSRSKTQRMNY